MSVQHEQGPYMTTRCICVQPGFCNNHHKAVPCVFVAFISILCVIHLALVSSSLVCADCCGFLSRARRPGRRPSFSFLPALLAYRGRQQSSERPLVWWRSSRRPFKPLLRKFVFYFPLKNRSLSTLVVMTILVTMTTWKRTKLCLCPVQ